MKKAEKKATVVSVKKQPVSASKPTKKSAVSSKAVPAEKEVKNTVKKASPAKVDAKKAPAKKASPAKADAKKAPAKKVSPAKADAKKVPVKKAAPVKTEVKKVPVKKASPVKAEVKKTVKKALPVKTEVKKAVVKKASPVPKAEPVKKSVRKREESLKKLRLSKADKKFFYDLLIHTRTSFGQQIQFHSEDALSSRRDSAGERAGMATHMADLGTDNYRHDFELGLMSEEVDVVEMIDEALQRLEDSEYGICLDCGEQIPRKRLEAKPYAKYCVKCKSRREQMDDQYHRR